MLEVLGVEAGPERVYRTLLARPQASAGDLAEALGMPESDVGRALEELLAAGLAVRSAGSGYVASPPAVALGPLVTERRDLLRVAEQAVAALAEEHRAAAEGRTIGELMEVVTGVDAVRHRYVQVQRAAKHDLRSFVTAPFVAVRPGQNPAESAVMRRGVRNRVVLERSVLTEPGATQELLDSLENGLDVRVVDALPVKLVLADADLALVPLTRSPASEPDAVLIQGSRLLDALGALFETVWHHAYPLEPASLDAPDVLAGGPTAMERRLLGLLLAGLSDQSAATQLGLSLRTVQRTLRRLQDRAGVESRIQLGWYAARHGWG